jgi:hypothetical protein
VQGWLLFFCISLTILSPLLTLANVFIGYGAASLVAARFPGFMIATIIDSVLVLVIMALGIFAGVYLWGVKPGAVQIAKAYLIVLAVYAVLEVPLFLAALPSSATDRFTERSTIAVLRTLFYVGLWYSYLSKSKRVKATYFDGDASDFIGLNLNAPAPLDPGQHTPGHSRPDTVEPVSQAGAPIRAEKPDYGDTPS